MIWQSIRWNFFIGINALAKKKDFINLIKTFKILMTFQI